MINHGISTGALFILVGVIYDRRHTREVAEFGGLAKVMPVYAAVFVIVTMASIGVPGTNGFVGEFLVIMGTYVSQSLGRHGALQAVLAASGVILAAVYMLGVVQKMFFGPITRPRNKNLKDLNVRETVALAPLVALIFVIGLFPSLLLDRMGDSVSHVIERYRDGRLAYQGMPPEATVATMQPRKGGMYERFYPKAPEEKSDDDTKQAAAAPAPPAGGAP